MSEYIGKTDCIHRTKLYTMPHALDTEQHYGVCCTALDGRVMALQIDGARPCFCEMYIAERRRDG